ncbi:MAG: hypothetical protein JMN27_15695 [gamma proteobacterium endosymbiont of Lamellibrachia anaximandri]|nr:hypothetical protein [gamma proteobacterium endosymbiont of Lamellibrachia anaximandri]MBL3535256.1 hypothetical protein [gamma proteobacterium endosymbiont of Lamellibrachia anaximandri]
MNPVHVIAMAAPNSVQFRSAGQSTAIPDITPAIAAGMCAGMPETWYRAACLKWAGDVSGAPALGRELLQYTSELAERENWRIPPDRDYVTRIVALAMAEVAEPGKWKFDIQRAKYLGIKRSTFVMTWKPRYEMVYRKLEGWKVEAYGYIQRNN